MTLPPTSNTEQENIIATCLSDMGLRYSQQTLFFPYTVDFYIEEINTVVEADGVYGHLSKRDRKRDKVLSEKHKVETIIHIKETTKVKIKEVLCQELNK